MEKPRPSSPVTAPASDGTSLNANGVSRSLAVRWGSSRAFDEGFVGVPAALLTRYAKLGLSPGEFVFVLELMVFKWDEHSPYPNYETLAYRMGITPEMARRHAKSLESKGMLKRLQRKGQSNRFDILPLTSMLDSLLAIEHQQPGAQKAGT